MDSHSTSNALSWLAPRRFLSLKRREYDWVFEFEEEARITVECLWRLIEEGRVLLTSEDHAQQFALPSPIDAAAELNQRVGGATLTRVELVAGTLDLRLHFADGHTLQIIPTSSGYEAWNVEGAAGRFVATGGGGLTILSKGDRTE